MAEVYSLDGNLKPIMRGDAPLPNVEPIVGDLAAQMLSNFGTVRDGVVLLVDGKKHWAAKYFLDRGQGGQLYGSGMVAWTEWSVAQSLRGDRPQIRDLQAYAGRRRRRQPKTRLASRQLLEMRSRFDRRLRRLKHNGFFDRRRHGDDAWR